MYACPLVGEYRPARSSSRPVLRLQGRAGGKGRALPWPRAPPGAARPAPAEAGARSSSLPPAGEAKRLPQAKLVPLCVWEAHSNPSYSEPFLLAGLAAICSGPLGRAACTPSWRTPSGRSPRLPPSPPGTDVPPNTLPSPANSSANPRCSEEEQNPSPGSERTHSSPSPASPAQQARRQHPLLLPTAGHSPYL